MKTTIKSGQHTLGPWHKGDKGEAAFHTTHIIGDDGSKVATVESYPYQTTGKADAQLIAAAPQLLAALQECADFLCDFNMHTIQWNLGQKAIDVINQATRTTQPYDQHPNTRGF